MFAEKHYPETIRPEELDAYLAQGWYRMGQTIFTTHFLCFGETFYSAVWVRLHLEKYRFRKSLRRIIRRNHHEFRTFFRKATIDREREQLYQRYKASFPGLLAPTLRDSLLDGEEMNIYNTHEVAVYHGKQLVAVSYFDLGHKSVASIMGMYDPDYQNYSLGFYTMLMEIAYAQEHNFEFYYPGYVVPGYARFDYKLRIGDVDYFDLGSEAWRPYQKLSQEEIPLLKMERKLQELQQVLHRDQLSSRTMYYPLFEVNLFGFWRTNFFDHPVFLHCSPHRLDNRHLVAVFDVREDAYALYECSPFDDIQFYFNEAYTNSFKRDHFFMELIVIDRVLERHPQPQAIADFLSQNRDLIAATTS